MSGSAQGSTGFAALREQFLDQPPETHIGHWDTLWQKNATPWDRNGPSLALKDAITGRPDLFGRVDSERRKRALVPGCGRGYDVLLLSSLGYDCFGLDSSQTAHNAAIQLQESSENDDQYSAYDPDVGVGSAKFLVRDFFSNDFLTETGGKDFDLIFDYTFLCALPPEMRPAWAKRLAELLSPSGHLVCLEWPLGKDPKEGGPPHGLTSELYVQLFKNPGADVKYDDAGIVRQDPNAEQGELALTRVAHFMPERTHEAGKGKDYVGIWHRSKP